MGPFGADPGTGNLALSPLTRDLATKREGLKNKESLKERHTEGMLNVTSVAGGRGVASSTLEL